MRKIFPVCALSSLFLILSVLTSGLSFGQDKAYFDKDWFRCGPGDAKYYRIVEEVDTLLKVTDYYKKGSVQSLGYIENTPHNIEILKVRGDFEQRTIGENKYYWKNGKMWYSINMSPFNRIHGIDTTHFSLLDSSDTSEIDSSSLYFETELVKRTTAYGFSLDEETRHGTWIYQHKSGAILWRRKYFKGELNGLSVKYWMNGNIKRTSPFENGFLNGEQKKYNRKGVLVKGKVYKNGILIDTWLYQKPKKKKS